MMTELVGPACEVVSYLWPSLARRINYVKNLKRNFEKLEKDVEALCNRREDIYTRIESDTSKILSRECQGWTKEVEKIETEVKKIKEEIDENRRCLNCCCFPDICAQKRLGKRIATMLDDVDKHNKRRPENVIVDAPPPVVEVIPLPVIKGGETAIERTVKCIMEKITDADNKIIGLWGMGGVGKTTALKSFNNLPGIAQIFQVVIWVTVSKEGTVGKVQNEIAQRLQINISDNESERTARKLYEKLRTKTYLLLLDDLWSAMNLEDVGIPLQDGSKVVLTTRYEKKWQEPRRISLMENELSGGLPTNLRWNKEFSTLLLQGNRYLGYIPDMFFQHMPSLRVLDLCYTNIKVLPGSVSNLVNLRGLYVRGYNPVDLPREIGALEKLEVLHVRVGSLPLEVRQLTSLRRLCVEFNEGKEEAMRTICSNGVISSLSLLEDLRIYFSIDYEGNLRREWCEVVDDSRVGEEVGRLKRLTRLQFDFSTIECFEHFLLQQQRNTNSCSFPGFKDFHLSMTSGIHVPDFPNFGREMEKTLMWNGGERLSSSEVKMSQILNQVLRFELISHKTGTSLLHLGMENIQRLEYCQVWDCPAMETIVVESNGPSTSTTNVTSVLLNLKVLGLHSLPNLRSICEDPRHRFTKLTELVISECPKLSSCVFTQGMIQHMPNLEVLRVWDCEGIEEIVMREDVEETNHHHLQLIFFPKLRVLVLHSCQNLVRIWKGASQPWPSIQEIAIGNCRNLENLNLNAVNDKNPLAALKFIYGKREWWEALKWEDENSKNRLQPLFEENAWAM